MATSSVTKLIKVSPDVTISTVITQPAQPPALGTPTLVFLHFWGGSSRTWSLVAPLLSSYTTVALDFRGWGDSTGPDKADAYSMAALASDVEAVIKEMHLEAVILIGLSMGAKVAQFIACRDNLSDTLKGMVLISPAPATPHLLKPEMREQQMHAYDTAETAEFVAKNVLTETFRDRELPDFVVADMLRGNKRAKKAWPAYGMAEDVSNGLKKVRLPVRVIAAVSDKVHGYHTVRTKVAEKNFGARMGAIKGSGHLSPLDASEEVAAGILKFMSGLQKEGERMALSRLKQAGELRSEDYVGN